jgi:SseB protein C-terminal domain
VTFTFRGEQDGPIERALKAELTELFNNLKTIELAYLAIATYEGDVESTVVLCLRSASNTDDPEIVAKIGGIFHKMFSEPEGLDVFFLDEESEHELMRVCSPFYRFVPTSIHNN